MLKGLLGAELVLSLGIWLSFAAAGMARPAGCARLSVLIAVATAALFGRATEGRRYGRGDREIQPEPGLMGAMGLRRLKQAKGRQLFRHGPPFGPLARRAALTAAPTPSQPGDLRSAAPAPPWRLWRCRPCRDWDADSRAPGAPPLS